MYACLIGSGISTTYSSGQLDEDVTLFCTAVSKLQEKFPLMKVEIICVAVNELSSLPFSRKDIVNSINIHNDTSTLQSVQLTLKKKLGSSVDFTVLRNSSMYFEEELRRLIAAYAPMTYMKLEFPPVNGNIFFAPAKPSTCCFLLFHLFIHSINCMSYLFDTFQLGMKCLIQFTLSAVTVNAADKLSKENWKNSSIFSVTSRYSEYV